MFPPIIRVCILLFVSSFAAGLYRRNAVTDPDRLWTNGKIPYVFHPGIDPYRRVHALAGMKQIMLSTYSGDNPCVLFVPRTTEADYIEIQFENADRSSGANVGRLGGKQIADISTQVTQDSLVQTLMFVLGIYPEVKRPDRDNVLEIDEDNVDASFASNLQIEPDTDTFSQPFDYDTVMMYLPYQFAINRSLPTIKAKYDGFTFGQSVSLTTGDVNLVQHIYNCPLDSTHSVDILGPLLFECHFHEDMCGFIQDPEDEFDWELAEGQVSIAGTGPFADHSSGSGTYAIAFAQEHNSQIARLMTPTLEPGTYCFVIWLYAYGPDIGSIRVIQSNADGDQELFGVEGSTILNAWHHGSATVQSTGSPVTIIVEGFMGSGDVGDFAIDDVYIYKGKCIDWF